MHSIKKLSTAIAVVGALSLAACGSDSADDTAAESTPTETQSETAEDSTGAGLVGPACTDYAESVPDGEGSVEGMSDDPVAVAASNNPLLTQLTAAVSGELNPDVNLVDTLNGDEFTVFAPVDDAFAQLDKKTVKALQKDADLLTSILTYHVVPGQMSPDEIAGQSLDTVQGDKVDVSGEGDSLQVNDANVICGGVMTENATVYLIDGVLTP